MVESGATATMLGAGGDVDAAHDAAAPVSKGVISQEEGMYKVGACMASMQSMQSPCGGVRGGVVRALAGQGWLVITSVQACTCGKRAVHALPALGCRRLLARHGRPVGGKTLPARLPGHGACPGPAPNFSPQLLTTHITPSLLPLLLLPPTHQVEYTHQGSSYTLGLFATLDESHRVCDVLTSERLFRRASEHREWEWVEPTA